MPITSKVVTRHSGEDVDLTISGFISEGEIVSEVIFDPSEFGCASARIMNVYRGIQSGVLALLCWDESETPATPLEGYGSMDLAKFGGLSNPRVEGWKGAIKLVVYPRPTGLGYFTVSLELSKQRN